MSTVEGPVPLERSTSQHSAASVRSYRSGTVRAARSRKLLSQPSSSASSIATSDKSLTSFPSFSPESPRVARSDETQRFQASPVNRSRTSSGRIVDSLVGKSSARDPLFEDAPLTQTVPGALHQADDQHIQRLISRHGAVALVRQVASDLAQRDAQIATIRRKADDRERALRRIIRECGLSNMDLEKRLKAVEDDLKANSRASATEDNSLSDLMSDAMRDAVTDASSLDVKLDSSTLRAASTSANNADNSKGTLRAWKDYLWGGGTTKKTGRRTTLDGERTDPALIVRSHSSFDRRPALQDDLFQPPNASEANSVRSASRASSVYAGQQPTDRKASGSLASLALRLVAGGAATPREGEQRGRTVSAVSRADSLRGASATSNRTAASNRSSSVAGGPKSLMAMRRNANNAPLAPASTKSQAQEMWGTMVGSPPSASTTRQESYGPVEMDAILPPESQPPTLTHIYNFTNGEYLTDRFGFIYDQRRKKRQREAAQMAKHIRNGSRTEMLLNGRSNISPNSLEDVPSPKHSVSSDGRPESPSSLEERVAEEGKTKRWQDYLKIATFPTELLSHTPSMSASAVEVTEGVSESGLETPEPEPSCRSPGITPTESGLVPMASTTTAVDNGTSQHSEGDSTAGALFKEDAEPVRLLLQQLSEVHDSLQREKTVRWNDFLRKVRAERRREGQAAMAAATAAAEARFERPAMILPEAQVADGEMIGISDLGHKGKVGRNKWNEFKNLVLGGIPVAYRAKVWSECSGATALRIPGYYEDLVSQTSDADDMIVVSQIQMDIHRTLTDNIFFRKGPGVQKLNEVLLAYARRNKDVGYCQGMNLIAANLLLIMPSAEDAFWILTSIVENILPQGYYDHSLLSSRADQQVLRQYVSTVLPKLSAHLDSLAIELEALTFQWFLSVFTDCLSAEALFRVWDVVLCTNDGSTFLFQVALALLKLNEGNLLKCATPAAVYTYINHQMTEHAISIDGLIQASEGLRRLVKREDVEQRRDRAIQAEKDMVSARTGRMSEPSSQIAVTPDGGSGSERELSLAEPRPMEE
ncbi:TBC domain-containing protein [Paramyrothecium foliicola]|nr:TBC domain-containing protein [Paramyrothecium foliicola]